MAELGTEAGCEAGAGCGAGAGCEAGVFGANADTAE